MPAKFVGIWGTHDVVGICDFFDMLFVGIRESRPKLQMPTKA